MDNQARPPLFQILQDPLTGKKTLYALCTPSPSLLQRLLEKTDRALGRCPDPLRRDELARTRVDLLAMIQLKEGLEPRFLSNSNLIEQPIPPGTTILGVRRAAPDAPTPEHRPLESLKTLETPATSPQFKIVIKGQDALESTSQPEALPNEADFLPKLEDQDEALIKPGKIYECVFKQQLVRRFRRYLNRQATAFMGYKHVQTPDNSKRQRTYDFYKSEYGIPAEIYMRYESIFFKLIFQGCTSVEMFGISETNSEVDKAIDGLFRSSPNKRNTQLFFTCPAIQGLWNNSWGGVAVPYSDSADIRTLLSKTEQLHIDVFRQRMRGIRVAFSDDRKLVSFSIK